MTAGACKRATRQDPGGRRVTPRDLLALSFVAAAQPVTTSQVRRLLGLSEDMAHRRLAVLRDHGLLRVHVAAQHEVNRYTLAPGAVPVLARLTGASPDEVYVPRGGVERADLAHHEATVDLYVTLRLATARAKTVRLLRWLFEREIRKAAGGASGALVPDAVGLFELEDGSRRAVAFEVDLGTENPSYVAAHKGQGYADLKAASAPMLGSLDWKVGCYVVAPERRLHRLGLALAEAKLPAGLWHLGLASRLDDRSVLGPVWVTPAVDASAKTATLVPSSPFETVGTRGRDSSDPQLAGEARLEADRPPVPSQAFASWERAR